MNPEILLRSPAFSDPFLVAGAAGVALMLGYIATQWWAATRRYAFEARRSRLELAELGKKIEVLNLKAQAAPEVAWNGFRKFTVARKVEECDDTYSFYLAPHNGRPLPPFKPGQYLTFEVQPPGAPKAQIRCYSLSDGALSEDHYRVTIKRFIKDDGTPGVVSTYFCDHVREGDILNVKAPSGKFFLDVEVDRPVVLISGGIGITPFLSLVASEAFARREGKSTLVYAVTDRAAAVYLDELRDRGKALPHLMIAHHYSDEAGYLDLAYLESAVEEPLPDCLFMICGPPQLMDAMRDLLAGAGVDDRQIIVEDFEIR